MNNGSINWFTNSNKSIVNVNSCFEALALKGIDYETHPVHLLKDGGQQVSAGIY